MKNVKKFEDFKLSEGFKSGVSDSDWKKFSTMIMELDFAEAFDFAQSAGIFGGDLQEYIDAKSNQGSAMAHIVAKFEKYVSAAEKLAEAIVEDLEGAQDDYGH
jgi:hypothetical protein